MFEDLEWNPDFVPPLKLGLHLAQILFAFIIFCIEIAVFRDDKSAVVGQNGWTFGVCFLSIPAWLFLCMAPRFPRTRKLANPYVMACIDGLYTIFWLSAFATQAAYNTANLCGGACGLSKAIVGLGFMTFLLFCGTTFVSLYTVQYFKWNGSLPGYDSKQPRTHNIDPDKAAFSMAPVDEEAYAPVGLNDQDHDDHSSHMDSHHYDDHHYEAPLAAESHAGSYSDQGAYGRDDAHVADNPFRQHENPFESDSDYHPQQQPAGGRIYAPPAVNDDYDDDRPAHFPAADYDRVTR